MSSYTQHDLSALAEATGFYQSFLQALGPVFFVESPIVIKSEYSNGGTIGFDDDGVAVFTPGEPE